MFANISNFTLVVVSLTGPSYRKKNRFLESACKDRGMKIRRGCRK